MTVSRYWGADLRDGEETEMSVMLLHVVKNINYQIMVMTY